MSNNFYVAGTIAFEASGWVQAASEDEALKDFMVMTQMFVHDGMRADDMVGNFRWTDVRIIPGVAPDAG